MKNILMLCFPILFLLACINKKKAQDKSPPLGLCSYCDSLNNTLRPFEYPLRVIDKNVEGIPLVENTDNTIRDSLNVLTDLEIKKIEDKLFCFIGKTEQKIDAYFPPEMNRVDWGKDRNGNKKKKYAFNRGNFISTAPPYQKVEEPQGSATIFSLEGGGNIELVLKLVKEEWVFIGTKQDSIRLEHCISKKGIK